MTQLPTNLDANGFKIDPRGRATRGANGTGYGVSVVINTDASAIARARSELREFSGKFNLAIKNAVNETLGRMRVRVVGQLGEKLTASPTNIRQSQNGTPRIIVLPFGQESPFGGTVRILNRPINAINFKTRVTPDGLSIQRWKDLPAKNYRGGFRGRGLNSNLLAFQRDASKPKRIQKKAHYKPNIGKMRQQLRGLAGVSLFRLYQNHPQYGQAIRGFAEQEFTKQLDSQVDRFLGRRKTERTAL